MSTARVGGGFLSPLGMGWLRTVLRVFPPRMIGFDVLVYKRCVELDALRSHRRVDTGVGRGRGRASVKEPGRASR